MTVARRTVLAFAAAVPFDHWIVRRRKPTRSHLYSDTYSTNTY